MNPFQSELQRLADRLDLPEPARTRVLLELAADLDDLNAAGLAAGLDPAAARARALEYCDLSDDALQGLARVHGPALRRLLESLPGPSRAWWERGLAGATVLMLCLVAGGLVAAPGFLARGSIFVQPLALLAVGAAATFLYRVYVLWLRQAHNPQRLRRGHALLPALALAMLVCGALGFWGELWWSAWQVHQLQAPALPATLDWLQRGSGLLVVSLAAAALTGLAWHTLEHKARRCEAAALAAVLHPMASRPPGAPEPRRTS